MSENSLNKKLDEIDLKIYSEAYESFYEFCLKILIHMWEKGEAINPIFRGVKMGISYYQLEKETGRDEEALKHWHDLYKKYPDKNIYYAIAEKQVETLTQKILAEKKRYNSH